MTRRLLVFALTFGLGAAPLAVTLCLVLCGDAPSMTAPQHSCHSDAASASPTLNAVPHACGHGTESPEGVEGSARPLTAFVAVVPAVAWIVPVPFAEPVAARSVEAPPPGPSPPTTQLRV